MKTAYVCGTADEFRAATRVADKDDRIVEIVSDFGELKGVEFDVISIGDGLDVRHYQVFGVVDWAGKRCIYHGTNAFQAYVWLRYAKTRGADVVWDPLIKHPADTFMSPDWQRRLEKIMGMPLVDGAA